MKNMQSLGSVLGVLALLLPPVVACAGTPKASRPAVVAYVPNWINLTAFAKTIDYARITRINLAFENPQNDSGDLSFNPQDAVLITEAHAHHVPILLSLGGGPQSEDPVMRQRYFVLMSDSKRAGFVAGITRFLTAHGFDGLDIDLEGPAIGSDYGAFIRDLATALKGQGRGQGKMLTAALSATYGGDQVPDSVFSRLDAVSIMAYDATGPWNPALPGPHSSLDFTKSSVAYWLGRGLPRSKAILGIPFYGYGFGKAFRPQAYPYSEIAAVYPGAENTDQIGETIWYNGIPAVQAKAAEVHTEGLGGIMVWSLDQDVPGKRSLLTALDQALHDK